MNIADFGSQFERGNTRVTWLSFAAILIVAFLHWAPYLDAGMPYFTREDEAHHFNRVVEMAKSGDLNPHYFHKPSLHFYLRLPAVIAGYLDSKRSTPIASIKEIRTRDTYGIADYAFSASHPKVVRWVRGVSLGLALITVGLSFWLTFRLTRTPLAAMAAGLLIALSPAFTQEATVVGVDVVMAAFVLLSVSLAVRYLDRESFALLIGAGLLAGLAVSSKYNALPVVFVPLAAAIAASRLTLGTAFLPLLAAALGFLLGSPYILTSLPLFADHLGYEVWHYGIAGHEGHTGEPGLGQLLHYARWLAVDGVGILALASAAIGAWLLVTRAPRSALTTLAFPFFFTILMCLQRANFERNMIVVIPFIAIAAGVGLQLVAKRLANGKSQPILLGLLPLLLLAQPFIGSIRLLGPSLHPEESRQALSRWAQEAALQGDIAIAGQLQPAQNLLALPGVERFDEGTAVIPELASAGFNWIVTSGHFVPPPETSGFLKELELIPGETAPQRIVANPAIRRFEVQTTNEAFKVFSRFRTRIELPTCLDANPGEDYCWASTRVADIIVQKAALRSATLSFMTPWKNQSMVLRSPSGAELTRVENLPPLEWRSVAVDPEISWVTLDISQIHSPAEMLGSPDKRRLGVAIRLAPAG